jgi:hypothetical protein
MLLSNYLREVSSLFHCQNKDAHCASFAFPPYDNRVLMERDVRERFNRLFKKLARVDDFPCRSLQQFLAIRAA